MATTPFHRILPLLAALGCAACQQDDACDTWFADADADGFGGLGAGVTVCDGDPTEGLADYGADCDDLDPAVHPGAAEVCDERDVDEDCSGAADDDDPNATGGVQTWPDADGDGFGDALAAIEQACNPTGPRVTTGGDCDDTNPESFPGATEVFGDLVDEDCDGRAVWELADDFELGSPDPLVLPTVAGNVVMSDLDAGGLARSGRWSADLGAAGELGSVVFDARRCENPNIEFYARRPPRAVDGEGSLSTQYFDGAGWVEAATVPLAEIWEWDFVLHRVVLDAAAEHSALEVRLLASADLDPAERVHIDDFRIVCAGTDADGDGLGARIDCDDANPADWSDCGVCLDADGDTFGEDCDLGPDCDDALATVTPGRLDQSFDGVDQDCDGLQGPFEDDMEDGHLDIWTTAGVFTPAAAHGGLRSMALSDYGYDYTFAESIPVDTTGCDTLSWSFWVLQPDNAPNSTIFAYYWNGTGWSQLAQALGSWDPVWTEYSGLIVDPAAIGPDFRLRFDDVVGAGYESVYVDDLVVTCGPADGDGDGVAADTDCDDADADHWQDCQGGCLDADGDGFGPSCDLGADCDDGNVSVYPGAADPFGDGVDAGCDGIDGTSLSDGFESALLDPAVWSGVVGDSMNVLFDRDYAASGDRSMVLLADDGGVETVDLDTSTCGAIFYRYAVKRGDAAHDFNNQDGPYCGMSVRLPMMNEFLSVSYWDGAAWVVADEHGGFEGIDPEFVTRSGVIEDPNASRADFAMQFTAATSECGPFYVDDVFVACTGPDADGDGRFPLADCDDADPDHWADCGACVDADGDGYGLLCDRGPDCDDGDASAHPDAAETDEDGVDSDCDGFELSAVLSDRFDAGALDPAVWATTTGDVGFSEFHGADRQSLWLTQASSASTVALDTSACPTIAWRAWIARGPEDPLSYNGTFRLSYLRSDGYWAEAFALAGGVYDPEEGAWYEGEITDPDAFWAGFAVELSTDGRSVLEGGFVHVDDLAVGCSGPDLDGDGAAEGVDCDDADPSHWSDCGGCVDADGDDFGVGCDQGPDCDDGDAAAHPGAFDLAADGLDPDCSGVDGPGLYDGFESGALGFPWQEVRGMTLFLECPPWDHEVTPAVVTTEVYSGLYSLRIEGTGYLESVLLDTTSCTEVGWEYQILGSQTPLTLEWWDGASWVVADVTDYVPAGYQQQAGVITDAAALSTAFRVRLSWVTSDLESVQVLLDDFEIVCQ